MTCLGHRTGLFDGMAEMPAAGSEAIAARCGLNERYVREWLGAMVASGVVDYDPRDGTYALPPEHAAFLTRAAAPAKLASQTRLAVNKEGKNGKRPLSKSAVNLCGMSLSKPDVQVFTNVIASCQYSRVIAPSPAARLGSSFGSVTLRGAPPIGGFMQCQIPAMSRWPDPKDVTLEPGL